MNRNLGPMFHGSDHSFNEGDIVEPRDNQGTAWASTNKDVAAGYGSHIYHVTPIADVTRHKGAAKEFGIHYSKTGFRVIKKLN